METTAKLRLPYILPSQAQKHVTHNESLQRLDAIVQLVILDELSSPPATVENGDCLLIAATATDTWAGRSGQLAFRQDNAWLFIQPREGWRAWFATENQVKILTGDTWTDLPSPSVGNFEQLGIAASSDAFNRLTISSPASLFNNAGGGHQIKINKAVSGDTASLLFQTSWTGHAEMGLAGTDDFSIKVSGDGETWATGLTISASGRVSMPNRPIFRAGLPAGNLTPASGSASGFSAIVINQGGFNLGNSVGTGLGQEIIVPATGLYLLVMSLAVISSSGHTVSVRINGVAASVATSGTASSASSQQSASSVILLNADDRITIGYTGTLQIGFGPGKTELSLVML